MPTSKDLLASKSYNYLLNKQSRQYFSRTTSNTKTFPGHPSTTTTDPCHLVPLTTLPTYIPTYLMTQPPCQPPLVVLLLGAVASMARAAVDKTRQKKRVRITRTLTREELGPLDAHVSRTHAEETTRGGQCTSSRKRLWWSYVSTSSSDGAVTSACKFAVFASALINAVVQHQWSIVCLLAALAVLFLWDLSRTKQQQQQVLVVPCNATMATTTAAATATATYVTATSTSTNTSEIESSDDEQNVDPGSGTVYEADLRLSGNWLRVPELSDSQDSAVELLKLGGIARAAMTMFKGMDVDMGKDTMHMRALTKVPFLKVPTEEYDLKGSIRNYKRRDLRKGHFFGYVKTQKDGGLNLYYKWDQPFSGHCCDEMRLYGGNELHITTHLTVGQDSCAYRVVYWRAGTTGSGETPPSTSPLMSLMRSASKAALDALGYETKPCFSVAQTAVMKGGGGARWSSFEGSAGDASDTCSEPAGATRRLYDSCDSNDSGRVRRQSHRLSAQRPFAKVLDL